jgi:hypothetical protein
MKLALQKRAEFFLERELHKRAGRYEPWYRFGYPVHYYYDLLVGLDFMTALGSAHLLHLNQIQRLLVLDFSNLGGGHL